MAPAPITAPAPVPVDAGHDERIAALVERARQGHSAFNAELSAARATVAGAAGAAVGSEAWVVGQQAVTRADARRTPVAESLADLDAMQVAGDGSSLLQAGITDVSALDREEVTALAGLRWGLSAP